MTSDLTPRNWLPGVMLVVFGVFLLVGQWVEFAGWLPLAAISALFLIAYAATRAYGLIIPGLIFAGLSVGVAVEETSVDLHGAAVVLGLSAAFLAIYVANTVLARPAQWWPLVPGAILGTVGVSQALQDTALAGVAASAWPIVLIAIGLFLLIQRSAPHRIERSQP